MHVARVIGTCIVRLEIETSRSRTRFVLLKGVLYCPEKLTNIVSIQAATSNSMTILFGREMKRRVQATGILKNDLYHFEVAMRDCNCLESLGSVEIL